MASMIPDMASVGTMHSGMPTSCSVDRCAIACESLDIVCSANLLCMHSLSPPLQVGTRIMKKRIHVRIEHAVPSRCREEFLKRRSDNDALKAEAKKSGSECCRSGEGLCSGVATTLAAGCDR